MGALVNLIQPSFAAGELGPAMRGRVDLAKYRAGAALMRNFFTMPYGGAATRAGSAIVGRTKQSAFQPRLFDFVYNQLQAYSLEFGNLYMRVIMNGGYVLEPSIAIAGITQAAPGVFNIVAHGYSGGDQIFLATIGGMVSLNSTAGFQCLVSNVVDANHVTLTDLDGNPINTVALAPYTGGGTAARLFTLVTPYLASDLPLLKYTQSADEMTLTHPSYAPMYLNRTQHWVWTITSITFAAAVQVPTGAAVAPVGGGGATTLDFYYVVTALTDAPSEESVPTGFVTCSNAALNQDTGINNHVTYIAPATGPTPNRYNVYAANPQAHGLPAPTIFGYIGQATGTDFFDTNIEADFTQQPPQHLNPFAGGVNPGCANYYQGRKWYGAPTAFPEALFSSQSSNYDNMDSSVPSEDSDAITITLTSRQVNAIKHIVAMNALLALTSSGAWMVSPGTQSAVITPTNISALAQAYNGCADVPPIPINYDILYVQARGSKVRDLAYNFYVNLYTGTDMSVLSSHLFFGFQITEWCYLEEPYYQILAVRNDGTLLAFTYLKEQDVYAWSHYDTNGLYKSICSIPEGQENAAYMVVQRTVPGVNGGLPCYFVERQASRNFYLSGVPDASLSWCVDSGVRYGPSPMAANLYPGAGAQNANAVNVPFFADAAVFAPGMIGNIIKANSGLASITGYIDQQHVTATILAAFQLMPNDPTFTPLPAVAGNAVAPMTGWFCTAPIATMTGLDHLNGMIVQLLVDGGVQTPRVVVNGTVQLDNPGTIVLAGLGYQCQLQTLAIDTGEPSIQGKMKRIAKVYLIVQDARGLKIGIPAQLPVVPAKLREIKNFNPHFTPPGTSPALASGIQGVTLDPQYQVEGAVLMQQDYPLPATILAVVPRVTVGDDEG